ncbi:MAG: hypothetical protein ACRDZW_05940, partial [Acidimicrobiales bacterium]
DFSQDLVNRLENEAEQRVLAARPFRVRSSDLFSFAAAPATVAGTDRRVFTIPVTEATRAVAASVSYPSTSLAGVNQFDYKLTVRDAAGAVVATTTPSSVAGSSSLFAELGQPAPSPRFGNWTFEVAGILGVTDPNLLLGNTVSVAIAQLEPLLRPAAATETKFQAMAVSTMFFTPVGPAGLLGGLDGCEAQDPPARGDLRPEPPKVPCRSAAVGFPVTSVLGAAAEFTTVPLADVAAVGGPAQLTLFLADPAAPVYAGKLAALIDYDLAAIASDGRVTPIKAGRIGKEAVVDGSPVKGTYRIEVPPTGLPGGTRLRLQLRFTGAYASGLRLYYGGAFAESGFAFTTGRLVAG